VNELPKTVRALTRSRRRRLYAAIAAALALAAAVAVVAVAGLGAGRSSEATGSAAATKPVVGKVTSLGGNKHLYRKGKSGKKTRLHEGDKLRLGNTVLADAGVKATLELTKPIDLDGDPELVRVKPLNKTEHTIKVVRISAAVVKVTIGD
jgi:hypothetical protein